MDIPFGNSTGFRKYSKRKPFASELPEPKYLINDNLQPGEYKTEFYTSRVKSRTYLCTMVAEGKSEFGKIIVTN